MQILFILKKFTQGYGGVPESVRMMAKELKAIGLISDVYDGKCLFYDIGKLDYLPKNAIMKTSLEDVDFAVYDHLINVGPWNSARLLWSAYRRRKKSAQLWYMPKGGLCQVEFLSHKGKLKLVYFFLIEIFWMCAADHQIFSSALEENSSILSQRFEKKNKIISDIFVFDLKKVAPPRRGRKKAQITISFLAEIDPRKGLLEAIAGVLAWAKMESLGTENLKLVIGGGTRPGRQNYYKKAKFLAAQANFQVEFLGPVSHENKNEFYDKTDIFLCTSQFESYGLTLLEALLSGCEVVAGKNLGALENVHGLPNLHISCDLAPNNIADTLKLAHAGAIAPAEQNGLSLSEAPSNVGITLSEINNTAISKLMAFLKTDNG